MRPCLPRIGNPLALLHDAYMLLESAQGIVYPMRDTLEPSLCVDPRALTLALKGAETPMEMSADSIEAARVHFEEIGKSWIASH